MDSKCDYASLALDNFNYREWYKDLDDSPPLEIEEEKYYTASSMPFLKDDWKKGKGLKILIPGKVLNRLPTLLAQIKAGFNSSKLKKTKLDK